MELQGKESNYQLWYLAHIPDDKYIYKNGWKNVYIFIRDTIIPLFDTEFENYEHLWGDKYFAAKKKSIDSYCEIIGEHISKSLVHPVVKITYKGIEIVFRYNFYDYEVAVIGDIPFYLPDKLFYSEGSSFFYQGFPKKYQLEDRYRNGANKFMVGVRNDYKFYTLMFLLRDSIDRHYSL